MRHPRGDGMRGAIVDALVPVLDPFGGEAAMAEFPNSVAAFAFILNRFSALADIIFRSFAQAGLPSYWITDNARDQIRYEDVDRDEDDFWSRPP